MVDSARRCPRSSCRERKGFPVGTILWLCCFVLAVPTSRRLQAQDSLIDGFTSEQVVSGQWRLGDEELLVGSDPGSRAVLADVAPTRYALTVEFTRTDGENSIGVILPVGNAQCAFIMSAFDGEAHGIGTIDGKIAKANESTIIPGKLQNDHPYRLLIEVDVTGDSVSISSTLDGRPFVGWSGTASSLGMLDFWKLRSNRNLGLMAYSPTTFHSITLAPLNSGMRMTRPAPPPTSSAATKRSSRKRMVYAQSHGERGGERLAAFANEINVDVSASSESITDAQLKQADLLCIRAPKTRIQQPEIDAIVRFVRGGGALLLVMDEEIRTPLAETGANRIIEPFGLRFTEDTEYLHNCGAICPAGEIHKVDREVPFSGGRAVEGGEPFGYQLDSDGNRGQVFAAFKETQGAGRIVILADGMAAGLMGSVNGERLSGVPRNPAQTTYWGKDSRDFLAEVIVWLANDS